MKFSGWMIFTGLLALTIPRTAGQNVVCEGILPHGTVIPNDKDCSAFKYCSHGGWTDARCPNGYYFNREVLRCLLNEGQCVPPAVTPSPQSCGPYPPGHMISTCHPITSNYYLICVNGVFLIQKCPEGYDFSFVNQNCIAPTGGNGSPDCGSLPDGISIAIPGSDFDFYVCIGGSPVLELCPNGLIFNPISTVCENPCGVYHPETNTGTYYVGSPSSKSGYYACTGGKIGAPQQCPASTQFYPALGSLSPSTACLNPNNVNKLCQANLYAAFPLTAKQSCHNFGFTPYYILCNNGLANIKRCPLGSVFSESGYCGATSINCEAISQPSAASSCICG